MREMKDSGVPWIGDIPNGWNLMKGRYCFDILSGFPFASDRFSNSSGFPLIRIRDITSGTIETFFDGDYPVEYVIKSGDLLVGMDGDFNIRLWSSVHALLNQRCCKITEKSQFDKRWLYYVLPFNLELINSLAYSTTVKHLSVPDLKEADIPTPSLLEQQRIADFLDSKCAEIDTILGKTRASIEEYKKLKQSVITEAVTKGIRGNRSMKESGIEWVGEMPTDWKIIRMKHLGLTWNGLTYSPDDVCSQAEGTLVLRSSNIQNGNLSFDDCVYVRSFIPEQKKVHEGDLLICSRNGSAKLIGKNAMIPANLDASFGAFMMVYRCKCPRFMRYVLSSSIFDYYLATFLSSTVNQLTTKNFDNIQFCYPTSEDERNEIVRYLDGRCVSIDTLFASKEALITELEAYKKSLIYEYVTGKKEVPES